MILTTVKMCHPVPSDYCKFDVEKCLIIICSTQSPHRRHINKMYPQHLALLHGFSGCCQKLLSSGKNHKPVSIKNLNCK